MKDKAGTVKRHAPPKGRCFQFRLRTLFLLTTAIAVWLSLEVNSARPQRIAEAMVLRLGGHVGYQHEADGYPEPRAPRWLRRCVGNDVFRRLIVINLQRTKVTDADLVKLKGLHDLKVLDLSGTQITDAGIAHLKGLTKDTQLLLPSTDGVTDRSLENLSELKNLEWLLLNNTKVSDAGIKYVRKFSNLQRLDLTGTSITDESIENLRGMTQLKWVSLSSTAITDKGVKYLSKMPKLSYVELIDCKNLFDPGLTEFERKGTTVHYSHTDP